MNVKEKKFVEIPKDSSQMNDSMEAAFLFNKLRLGAIFLKHGQRGNPHYRSVWVEQNLSRINWGDLKRKKIHGHIYTQHVKEIVEGHKTKVFQRASKNSEPKKSFSLISDKRTLDLEGISTEQKATWVMAFRFLLQYYKNINDDDQFVNSKKDKSHSKSHRSRSKSRRSRSKSVRSVSKYDTAEDGEHFIRGKGTGERATPCWVGGTEKTPKSTANLLDLVSSLNERLEATEAQRIKMTRLCETWKEDSRRLYMSAMRKSLECQEVIDSLRCRVDELTADNEWLTKKIQSSSPTPNIPNFRT